MEVPDPAAVVGTEQLVRAVNVPREDFGVRRLLLEGGGYINGALLDAGLVGEVSLLIAPGLDGSNDVPTIFDGVRSHSGKAIPVKLKSVEAPREKHDLASVRKTGSDQPS